MANQRDGLFDQNLGDGLIEINEHSEETAAPVVETEVAPVIDKETENVEPYVEDEDGMIDIDEELQATINASKLKDAENNGADIEKIEKEKEKAPSDGDGSGDSSPSSSQYLAFAKDRASEGEFLDFTDEDWKVLVERNNGDESLALRELSSISIQESVKAGVEEYKKTLTDQERALYEAKEKGVPVDEYGLAKHNYDKYSKILPEQLTDNVELQEQIVAKGLEIRGFSKEEVAEEIEGYKALDNLKAKAEKVLPLIPKHYNSKIETLESNAEAEQLAVKDNIRKGVAKMKSLVEQTPEIIPGIKLTKPTRDKIMSSMTQPVAKDAKGQPLNPVMATRNKNPEAFEMMIHYYHQLGLFNIDENGAVKPDFSKIKTTMKTETVDELKSIFESKEKPVGGKARKIKTVTDDLDDFDKAFGRL